MTTKHTPTPWIVQKHNNTSGKIIADNFVGEPQVLIMRFDSGLVDNGKSQVLIDAEHICKCVNEHAELLAALEGLLEQVTGPAGVWGDGRGNDGKKTGLSGQEFNDLKDARIQKARTIIAKSKQ